MDKFFSARRVLNWMVYINLSSAVIDARDGGRVPSSSEGFKCLLLLYSSLGDAEGIGKLASLSKEHEKNNVAFLCLFMLGKLKDCIQLLIDSNRIPEAALMARSYLPSKVSEMVAIWRNDLCKVNPKAAESLADPSEYPNSFDDWQVALTVEKNVASQRGQYPPADEYLNHAEKSDTTLVEAFKRMQIIEDEEPVDPAEENGEPDQEALEENEMENTDEAVPVDAYESEETALVNGNEDEDQPSTNNEGAASA